MFEENKLEQCSRFVNVLKDCQSVCRMHLAAAISNESLKNNYTLESHL